MNRAKEISLVATMLGCVYIVVVAFSGKDLVRTSLADFTLFFNRVYLGIALLILILLIFASNRGMDDFSKAKGWGWAAAFGTVLLISLLMAYYANPHGRFPTQRYLFATALARQIKSGLYEKIDYDPQLIILGSSRAFILAPEYIEKKNRL
jgi:hypothetical protein